MLDTFRKAKYFQELRCKWCLNAPPSFLSISSISQNQEFHTGAATLEVLMLLRAFCLFPLAKATTWADQNSACLNAPPSFLSISSCIPCEADYVVTKS